eukprot:TRINITY_DN17416_c1_g1_i1.p3 TRINITY_DN17416_c1_g1~~TRINITY_DN17416_c1_g1_i1.p3  ORF type:complete len:102 (+),score=14.51 TRINITY_DN17416_c1_g1_i1:1348-1653(+)
MHDFDTIDEIYNKSKGVELELWSSNMRRFCTPTRESIPRRALEFQNYCAPPQGCCPALEFQNNRAPPQGHRPPQRQQQHNQPNQRPFVPNQRGADHRDVDL